MTATSDLSEGPVLTVINKRINNIRRKLKRITEIEQQTPRLLTKYDNDLLSSKPILMAVVDELEKLRQPLTVAVDEERKNDDVIIEILMKFFYIGNLFHMKTKSEFENVMLSRTNERKWCLECHDVKLVEGDLDVVGEMSELFVTRPTAESSFSHELALRRCVDHAKMLIAASEARISSNNNVTYAGLRDLLAQIVGSDYYKTPPQTVDVDSRVRDSLVELKGADGADFQRNNVYGVHSSPVDDHPKVHNHGDIPLEELQRGVETGRVWTEVQALTEDLKDQCVLFRGRVNGIRSVGKKMAFLTVRKRLNTVQCILIVEAEDGLCNTEMLNYVVGLSKESLVDVEGVVKVPTRPITSTTQQVEVKVSKIHCVNRAAIGLPITLEDATRSKLEYEKALKSGKQLVHVNQDTRLNNRVLDLRTPANQAIFRLQSRLLNFFREFLLKHDFLEIITPKLVAGRSEGGAAVFELNYFDQPASLTQSAQLYKQMAISADFQRVFVVGPAFRAEKSYTHRHLCEFTGLDVEMEIIDHYYEVMDIVDSLFVEMFDKLQDTCQIELDSIGKQYPFNPLKYLRKTLRLTFDEGIQMLKEAGLKVNPLEDLNTESERMLGKLVLEKYGTEFYILYRYPLAVRPFFTMPCHENKSYSNSFDVFMRGEEIISGSQRIHDEMLLESRAKECGVDVKTISMFIDSLRYGAPPRGGFGAGLERIVMLFCGLENIRLASLFPRDPRRLEP